jgi:hypothetical protein
MWNGSACQKGCSSMIPVKGLFKLGN